jgi:hypothetical protein
MRRFVYYNAASGLDPNALAYIAANTAITDELDKAVINDFYKGLKFDGTYNLIDAMYLPIWASAANNKWNLKDPRDLNAAFRLTFTGGWTHSANGALPNGLNGYANTYYSPNANQGLFSGHFSLYSRTQAGSTNGIGANGVRDQITGVGVQCSPRRQDNASFFVMHNEGTGGVALTTSTDGRGFWLGSRTAINSNKYYKNATIIAQNTANQAATTMSINNYFIGAINQGGFPLANTYDNKQISFASLGLGLSDSQVTALYNRVQTLMTHFGLNV